MMIRYKYNEVKKPKQPKNENGVFWAAFAPDGAVQVRSISPTKKMAREQLCDINETWEGYERAGFVIKRVFFSLTVQND